MSSRACRYRHPELDSGSPLKEMLNSVARNHVQHDTASFCMTQLRLARHGFVWHDSDKLISLVRGFPLLRIGRAFHHSVPLGAPHCAPRLVPRPNPSGSPHLKQSEPPILANLLSCKQLPHFPPKWQPWRLPPLSLWISQPA